jgi:hypothetical protein
MQGKLPKEAGRLPWTNDGKLLLLTFNRLVKEGGGHFVMWSKTRKEAIPPKEPRVKKRKMRRSAWMHRHAPFIMDNYKSMRVDQMAAQLGCSHQNVSWILRGLKVKKGSLFNRGSYPSFNRYYYDIIDLETGVFYDNCAQVAHAINKPLRTVQGWIKGTRLAGCYCRFKKL